MHDDGYVTTVTQTRLLHRPVPKLLRTLKMHVQGYETKTYTICIVTNRTTRGRGHRCITSKRTWPSVQHIEEDVWCGVKWGSCPNQFNFVEATARSAASPRRGAGVAGRGRGDATADLGSCPHKIKLIRRILILRHTIHLLRCASSCDL